MVNPESRISRRGFLKLSAFTAAGAVLSACSGESSPAAAPAKVQPTATMSQAWESRCAVDITVVDGDTVDGSIFRRAAETCHDIDLDDVRNSWRFQFGPDRKMDTIQPKEVLRLTDFVKR